MLAGEGRRAVSGAAPTMNAMRTPSFRPSARRSPAGRSSAPAPVPVVRVIDGIETHITRKRIRNLYLRVKPPEGRVEVSAPMRMPLATIDAFVAARHDWILEQRHRVAAAPVTPKAAWDAERKARAAAAIEARLPALLTHWTPIVGRAPTHVTLRLMTSRWGSCTPRTGRIRLNLQLAELPPEMLEYVLVHEMTHLWASGHGAEFQRRMDCYLPDWRTLRRELNRRVVA